MAPAVKKVIGEDPFIRYFGVDATNYGSLKNALAEAQGELLITTEGLLMYLTQPELDEVFRGIHILLENFGGKWITTDNEILAAHYRLLAALKGDSPDLPGPEHKAPSSAPGNDFLKASAAPQYVEKMGFDLKKIPVFDYLPASLLSLDQMPDKKRNAVRDTFKEMFFWVMSVKEDTDKKADEEEVPFSVSAALKEGVLNLTVSGRLDTITAPELLSVYQGECEKEKVRSIILDLRSLTYISSAGLRVFLIMRKSLADGNQFQLRNMNETVKDIMNLTGFSDLFNCSDH